MLCLISRSGSIRSLNVVESAGLRVILEPGKGKPSYSVCIHIKSQNADLDSQASIQTGTSFSAGNVHFVLTGWAGYSIQAIVHHPSSATGTRIAPIQYGNRMYVFKLNGTNTPVYDYWDPTANGGLGSWSGWTSMGGTLAGDMAAINYGSEMDVYGVASNGQVVRNTWNGSTWSNWSSLQGTMTGRPAAIYYNSSEMDVYAHNPNDNKIYKDTTFDGINWTGWSALTGAPALGNPAVVQFNSEMDVYMRGSDNAIYKDTYNGSTWLGFSSLGGGLVGDPTAMQYSSTEMDVYATASNGQVVRDKWNGTWSNWTSLSTTVLMTGSPFALKYGSSEMDVYAHRSSDNQIYKDTTQDGNNWGGFGSLTGNEAGDPTALQYGSTEMDVYVTNSLLNTDKDTWNGSGWGGFSPLY